MVNRPLDRRVEILEEQMDSLTSRPGRVSRVEAVTEALKEEMWGLREEFSLIRAEMRAEFVNVRRDIREGDEETRRQMRVLHEDVIARIALLQKGLACANGRPSGSRRERKPRKH